MAGTFGLQSAGYEASLAAGRPMLDELSRPAVMFGSTECSACRLQMEEGSGKRTLHPVQYLALAYGLMPELARRLREPIRTLVDTWLGRHETIWAAAGHPHTVFPTTFAELLRITGGTPADVGD